MITDVVQNSSLQVQIFALKLLRQIQFKEININKNSLL